MKKITFKYITSNPILCTIPPLKIPSATEARLIVKIFVDPPRIFSSPR